MTFDSHYTQRYLFTDWEQLCQRVSRTIANDDETLTQEFFNIMVHKNFLPAGNTLVAGAKPIAPNCSILGLLTDDNLEEMIAISIKLWKQGTGIGFDLSGLTSPVKVLQQLSHINDSIDLVHRPKRGNMAVLSATHPDIKQFITCKSSGNEIYNFNISVIYDPNMDEDTFNLIAQQAWATGDPGLIFLDKGRSYGPVQATDLEPVTTCVPCGEQFMHAYETCNLGSINLHSTHLRNDNNEIDLDKLRTVVHTAVTFLDRVIDHLVYPHDTIERVSLACRRIGLGVTGFADYLKDVNIAYNSEEALALARKLSRFITSQAEVQSRKLAQLYAPCHYSSQYRNISLTCIAPTGGITGLLFLKGYAIEPWFEDAVNYDYKAHLDMQAAWQEGIHNAVSKTVNLPFDATVNEVKEIYRYAYESGCKGVTIYRDGSKIFQPRDLSSCPQCESTGYENGAYANL
jgi:ribonucleoside-diphosphate reductase alpha chain